MRVFWWSAALFMSLLMAGAVDSAQRGDGISAVAAGVDAVIWIWCIRKAVIAK
jgi:hypothetical protein